MTAEHKHLVENPTGNGRCTECGEMVIENILTATPVEIDSMLYSIYVAIGDARVKAGYAWGSVEHKVRDYLRKTWRQPLSDKEVRDVLREVWEFHEADEIKAMIASDDIDTRVNGYRMQDVLEAGQAHEAAVERVTDLIMSQQPYDEEWERRGRWTRAYLVANANGHVHKSMHCSTCFDTTRYHWLVEMADHSEEEIVEKAGERACTVCYPSAPAEVLNRPTQFFTPDEEEAQRAREEREAKRREREAAKITLTVWGQGYRDDSPRLKEVTWKTTRALQNDTGALVRGVTGSYAMINGFSLPLTEYNGVGRVPVNKEEALHNLRVMVAALAERGVDTDALVAKNHKRAVKDGGRNWDGVL